MKEAWSLIRRTGLIAIVGGLFLHSAGLPGAEAPPAVPQTVAELRAVEERVRQTVAKVLPSTVGLRIRNSQGSGVIVSKEGLIATAGHLIQRPGDPVVIILPNGKAHHGVTLGFDQASERDIGMVKVTCKCPGPWIPVALGTAADAQAGAWCLAVGHPHGYVSERPPVVRLGRILSVFDATLRSDCSIVAGDSGGPLFSLDGKLIGISSRIGDNNSMNYHLSIEAYRRHWEQLVAGKRLRDDLPGREQPAIKQAFRPAIAAARRSTVRVKCAGKEAAWGAVVDGDGWIVTKASELRAPIVCRLADGREAEAKLQGVADDLDLALLKIELGGLTAVEWSATEPAVGQWVATAAATEEPLAIGVVSVPLRKIAPPQVALGVTVNDTPQGPQIHQVLPQSPAEKGGLQQGDVIAAINGQATSTHEKLAATVQRFRPGDRLRVSVRRESQTLEVRVILDVVDKERGRAKANQDNMGTGVSGRRDDFPGVLQHDSVLRPVDCGGPLVDLSGKVVGLNIARAGRTETYSLPAATVQAKLPALRSGSLAPGRVRNE